MRCSQDLSNSSEQPPNGDQSNHLRSEERFQARQRKSGLPSLSKRQNSSMERLLYRRNEARPDGLQSNASQNPSILRKIVSMTNNPSLSLLIFYLCINQIYNNLVSQAGQMNLHNVPNDMIQVFSGVACVIFGPIIQGLYSLLAKRKIPFGPIARITAAFIVCAGAMAYAAGVQQLIYRSGPCYQYPLSCESSQDGTIPNDISVWVQLPIYFILAVAEIFGFVTASEYAYSKAPKDMKAVVQAIMQLTACVASALGMALSLVSKDPKLVIMYASLAAAMGVSAALFFSKFSRYDDREDEMNKTNIQEDVKSTDNCGVSVRDEERP